MSRTPGRCPDCGLMFKDLARHLSHPATSCTSDARAARMHYTLDHGLGLLPDELRLTVPGYPLVPVRALRAILSERPEGRALLAERAIVHIDRKSYRGGRTECTATVWVAGADEPWAEAPAQLL